MKFLDIIPAWAWALVLMICVTKGCISDANHKAEAASLRAEISIRDLTLETERRIAAENHDNQQTEARRIEKELQEAADKSRKDLQHEITAISTQRDRALDELRKRPSRPTPGATTGNAGVPTDPSAGQAPAGCTGAGLFREDGEFLVRESARANTIRAALSSCYAAVDRARSQVDEKAVAQ